MAAVVQHPHVNGRSGEWWIDLCDKLAKVGTCNRLQEKHGIDEDHIAEFTFWFMLPFAARHGLPSSLKLTGFIAGAEYNLDMDESIGAHLALVPNVKPAMDSSHGLQLTRAARAERRLDTRRTTLSHGAKMQGWRELDSLVADSYLWQTYFLPAAPLCPPLTGPSSALGVAPPPPS